MNNSTSEIICRNVWKVFGPQPERFLKAVLESANGEVRPDGQHVAAVRNVSFDVKRGETFVVMGLSGSGKSTLVRCISRLTEPTHGAIVIGGRDVLKLPEAELRELRRHKVSMVFQNFGLFPHRRVIDNVAYGLEVRGVPRSERWDKAREMIELVGLKGWEQHYPRQLSGGMQQRVGLARALTVDPEIILFDEPFSALDPLIRREMQDELLRLQATLHKTSVFITHDFAEALKLGDHIAIMRNGRLVQLGTPEELVLHPSDDYVRAFTQDAPRGKVLTASTIMQACPDNFSREGKPTVRADAKLDDVMPLVAAHEGRLPVTNDAGELVGCVDRVAVMRALIQ
jgi:glycine betaine/proline transport system ATP-binding protein